jgi:tetratricopeptide (TPR) repeat protein
MGDLQAARPYYDRALQIREAVLGPTHPDTAQSLNNLGMLLQAQGDLQAARPHLERALQIVELRLGADHLTTRTIRANLAALDNSQPSAAQQIGDITAQFEAAVASALADPASDRAALLQQIEDRARWAEQGEAEGSPYLALAARLRAIVEQLTKSSAEPPSEQF